MINVIFIFATIICTGFSSPCPKSTFKTEQGCSPCQEGSYGDEIDAAQCKQCPIGYYQNFVGKDSCKTCHLATVAGEKQCGSELLSLEDYASAYRITRDAYYEASRKLKRAAGPYKSARDAWTTVTAVYTKSLFERRRLISDK